MRHMIRADAVGANDSLFNLHKFFADLNEPVALVKAALFAILVDALRKRQFPLRRVLSDSHARHVPARHFQGCSGWNGVLHPSLSTAAAAFLALSESEQPLASL